MRGAAPAALERAREGDREAFQVLVEQHSRQIFHLAFRMTGNEADAEDVVQETFLRAYRKMGEYDFRARFSTWVHRIAANYAIDLLRRRRRWRSTEIDPVEQSDPLTTDDAGPERWAFSGEIGRRIGEALETLTPKERVAFTLRHYEGMTIEQIGRVLGTRTNSTKNHVFRAVRKLRSKLAPLTESSG